MEGLRWPRLLGVRASFLPTLHLFETTDSGENNGIAGSFSNDRGKPATVDPVRLFTIIKWVERMSSGLLIDQSCASLPIPKLFPKVGKPQILIHKLDSTPAFSTDMPRWDCFWYQGLGDGYKGIWYALKTGGG